MEQLRSTSGKKGMILDLRDNKQGDLTTLITLYPFLVHHNDSPKIANLRS
jgi:TFIIF-interacting CTD phosphatase-like protein